MNKQEIIKIVEDGSKEEMLYNGIDLLDRLAYRLVSTENNNEVTIESLQQDNDLLLLFVKTYRLIAPSIKDVIEDVMEFDL